MKSYDEIYADLYARYCEETGFSMDDSADLAVRLRACAAELESLYRYADYCVQQTFPQTAVGEALDRHAAMRALTRKAGAAAAGSIRFSIDAALESPLTVPAGTVCTTAGLQRFVTTAEAVIPAGSLSGDAPAVAESAGAGGNVAAGTITRMPLMPTGVSACTNPAAFTGGSDAESDEDLRARILDSYALLPNGANAAGYVEQALACEGVAAAVVVPRANGVGTVKVVIASPEGLPEAALLETVEARLQSAREIAVDVTVAAPTEVPVTVTGTITPREGADTETVLAAAEAAVKGCFSGTQLGKNVRLAALISAVMACDGVENVVFTSPSADVSVAGTGLAILSGLTLTEGA